MIKLAWGGMKTILCWFGFCLHFCSDPQEHWKEEQSLFFVSIHGTFTTKGFLKGGVVTNCLLVAQYLSISDKGNRSLIFIGVIERMNGMESGWWHVCL
jgi:hypothetical protein